jgi:uncharacterized protein YkwD
MRRFLSFRYVVILCLILLGLFFYLYNLIPHKYESQYTYIPSKTKPSDSSDTQEASSDNDVSGNGSTASEDNTNEQIPDESDIRIKVRGTAISLGENKDDIISKLGAPGRIDETEYDFDFYIYNNDYKRLLYIAVSNDKAVGFYTDSLDFDYMGIKSGSTLETVNEVLKQDYSLNEFIEYKADSYTAQVFMDTLDSHRVTGIYVLSNSVKFDKYTEKAKRNIELMIYDLTNSIRVRNKMPVLSWSSSAALASRKHSQDMAVNNFFSHRNLKREMPGDRLRAEGIFVTTNSENLVAGYDTAIVSVHKLFNSKTHRNNILSKKIRYIGVGFAYVPDSKYLTYITQNFYR